MSAAPHLRIRRDAPAVPVPDLTPWDALWLALEVKEQAERSGDAATVADCDAMLAHTRAQLAAIGGLLVLHALDSDVVRAKFAAIYRDAAAGWRVARQAAKAAADAQERVQALGDRVTELERRLEAP